MRGGLGREELLQVVRGLRRQADPGGETGRHTAVVAEGHQRREADEDRHDEEEPQRREDERLVQDVDLNGAAGHVDRGRALEPPAGLLVARADPGGSHPSGLRLLPLGRLGHRVTSAAA
ncbi:hypothetical protein PHK61_29140 [Actinomycetospora lutea]|uniref:hypothetical protein n=1 Tax=Actinomycetospora lutea TaxID=663604 RepID=UPI002365A6F9|nr:hypothetical protein [Actinomycetospora lutea]MDD7942487.1 hypothetical protein [Actinomycetospora lutea]